MSAFIFDTEATDRENGEIIEAAWLRMRDVADIAGASDRIDYSLEDSIVERFCERYRPSKPSTFGAMSVHHILPSELEGCSPSSEFRLPGACEYLIGHNVDFDWQLAGSPERIKRICTKAIASHLWPTADSHSQAALLYMLEGATPATRDLLRHAHSAAQDCLNNLTLLSHILEAKPDVQTWSALWQLSEDSRIPLVCPFQKYKGVPLPELPLDFVAWCLRQDWIDPYLRKGLTRVMEAA